MFKLMLQFIQVAKMQNVTKAANNLCLSQPTLTQNMRKLETNLDTKLFIRSSRGITLTDSGELLFEQGKMMKRLYENTLNKLQQDKLRHQTELNIGCGDAWWHLFIRDSVQVFRNTHPLANINIDVGDHLHLMDLLQSGDINLFVGHEILGLELYEDVRFYPLFVTLEEVYVREGHPLSAQQCSDQDIARFPTIDLGAPQKRFTHLQHQSPELSAFQKRHYLQDKTIYRTNSLLTALDLLQNSDGILPYPAAMRDYFATFGLTQLHMKECFNECSIGVYINKDQSQDEQTIALIAQFRSIIDSKSYINGY